MRRRTLFRIVVGLSVLLFFACAPKAPLLLQGNHAGGSPHYRVEIDSLGRKHGAERWWHENGTLKSEATWRAGVRDGAYRAWNPDGVPWYAGRDSLGVPVDTLRFWHPNGRLRILSVFEGGVSVRLDEFDTLGLTTEESRARAAAAIESEKRLHRNDSLSVRDAARRKALEEWSTRARASVEIWWSLPPSLMKTSRRATARLRVARDGTLLGVTWTEKSGSREFDARAARALTKAKKFPPLPPEVAPPLELVYAFTTPGLAPPRRKLQLRDPAAAMGDTTRADDVGDP